MMTESMIVIQNVYFSRGDKPIFKGLNLTIPRGKVTAIMGPSGTGKTTLLRLIGGEIVPSQGEILVDGINIAELSRHRLYAMRRKMGILFQEGALFTDLNVFENVAFLLREHTQLPEDMIRDLVLARLEAVGLRGAHQLQINECSGGMARRVALARAIMLDPELMMYDEPFTGQDPINRGILMTLIRQLNNAMGLTSIVVSHDVDEVIKVADWVYVIADGQVMGQGTPSELMSSTVPQVHQFVHGLPDGPVAFQYRANDYCEDLGIVRY